MFNNIYEVLMIMSTVVGAAWTLAFWFSGKIESKNERVIKKIDQVLDKLEYHERHDDQRFSSLRDDIWEIRVTQAARGQISGPPKEVSTVI
jgi:hypothetical protein